MSVRIFSLNKDLLRNNNKLNYEVITKVSFLLQSFFYCHGFHCLGQRSKKTYIVTNGPYVRKYHYRSMYENNMLWKLTFPQHYKQYDTF